MQSGIYEIVNTTNGKRYVGSAVNLDRRDHRAKIGAWHRGKKVSDETRAKLRAAKLRYYETLRQEASP